MERMFDFDNYAFIERLEVLQVQADYLYPKMLEHVLAALMPANRLAIQVSLATGLRIGDVLEIKTQDLVKGCRTVREGKTGKARRVRLPKQLQEEIMCQCGHIYAFPGRSDGKRHRTRQTVYKDIRRAADAFRLRAHISCHTARKCFAVEQYHKYHDSKQVQKLLNHSNEAVTLIYIMADELTAQRLAK